MTGQEHAAEAERLLSTTEQTIRDASPNSLNAAFDVADRSIAAAQVHATLALAAQTQAVAETADSICNALNVLATR